MSHRKHLPSEEQESHTAGHSQWYHRKLSNQALLLVFHRNKPQCNFPWLGAISSDSVGFWNYNNFLPIKFPQNIVISLVIFDNTVVFRNWVIYFK